jgi:prepilin-type N-terminal cleavage/methylation domain-containing protein
MRDPRARVQRGFTLIEMMIVVAVIAILAAIAVPAYFSQSRKSKASSEVSAMFAEMSTKEEQYKVEKGGYWGSAISTAGQSSSATCPSPLPSATLTSTSSCVTSTDWTTLHINPPDTKVWCQYTITVGPSTVTPTPAGFTMLSDGTAFAPITSWYYILATCDMDGSSTTNSTYFISSADTKIQSKNEGF